MNLRRLAKAVLILNILFWIGFGIFLSYRPYFFCESSWIFPYISRSPLGLVILCFGALGLAFLGGSWKYRTRSAYSLALISFLLAANCGLLLIAQGWPHERPNTTLDGACASPGNLCRESKFNSVSPADGEEWYFSYWAGNCLRSFGAFPYFHSTGKFAGFSIQRIHDASLLTHIGLRYGDVIVSIDDAPASKSGTFLKKLRLLDRGESFRAIIERNEDFPRKGDWKTIEIVYPRKLENS